MVLATHIEMNDPAGAMTRTSGVASCLDGGAAGGDNGNAGGGQENGTCGAGGGGGGAEVNCGA